MVLIKSIMGNLQKGHTITIWYNNRYYKRYDRCMLEKFSITYADPDTLLNKRTELTSKCRHKNRFLLANVKK